MKNKRLIRTIRTLKKARKNLAKLTLRETLDIVTDNLLVPLDLALVTKEARRRGGPYFGRDFNNLQSGARVYSALTREGYSNLAQIAARSRVEISTIRKIGEKGQAYLDKLMQKYGFKFEVSDEKARRKFASAYKP